jgi:hypothetical protein
MELLLASQRFLGPFLDHGRYVSCMSGSPSSLFTCRRQRRQAGLKGDVTACPPAGLMLKGSSSLSGAYDYNRPDRFA